MDEYFAIRIEKNIKEAIRQAEDRITSRIKALEKKLEPFTNIINKDTKEEYEK